MKIVAYSAWRKPEIFTVKSRKAAQRKISELKSQQLLVELHTEKEYKRFW